MIAISCPHCQDTTVIRFGKNRSGTPRFRCKACGKTWVENPQSRSLSQDKADEIVRALAERALAERISQRGIARALKVSRDTIRALRKKRQSE